MQIDITELDLSTKQWQYVLKTYPEYADEYPWNELRDYAGIMVDAILEHEIYFKYVNLDKFRGNHWIMLVKKYPHMIKKMPWSKLSGYNWACLLRNYPEYADKCPWEKLDGHDWAILTEAQQQFIDKCNIKKLKHRDWKRIILKIPSFADRCYRNIDWFEIVERRPQLYKKIVKKEYGNARWAKLLGQQPQFQIRKLSNKLCCPLFTKLDSTEYDDEHDTLYDFMIPPSYESIVEIDNVQDYNWRINQIWSF